MGGRVSGGPHCRLRPYHQRRLFRLWGTARSLQARKSPRHSRTTVKYSASELPAARAVHPMRRCRRCYRIEARIPTLPVTCSLIPPAGNSPYPIISGRQRPASGTVPLHHPRRSASHDRFCLHTQFLLPLPIKVGDSCLAFCHCGGIQSSYRTAMMARPVPPVPPPARRRLHPFVFAVQRRWQ